jgi:hypothetical protein
LGLALVEMGRPRAGVRGLTTSTSPGVEKPRTDVMRVDELAEVHVDVGDLVLLEKG